MKSTNERVRFSLFKDWFNRLFRITPKKVGNFLTKQEEASFDDVRNYVNEHVKLNFFNGSKFIRDEFKTDKQLLVDQSKVYGQ